MGDRRSGRYRAAANERAMKKYRRYQAGGGIPVWSLSAWPREPGCDGSRLGSNHKGLRETDSGLVPCQDLAASRSRSPGRQGSPGMRSRTDGPVFPSSTGRTPSHTIFIAGCRRPRYPRIRPPPVPRLPALRDVGPATAFLEGLQYQGLVRALGRHHPLVGAPSPHWIGISLSALGTPSRWDQDFPLRPLSWRPTSSSAGCSTPSTRPLRRPLPSTTPGTNENTSARTANGRRWRVLGRGAWSGTRSVNGMVRDCQFPRQHGHQSASCSPTIPGSTFRGRQLRTNTSGKRGAISRWKRSLTP